MKSCSAHWWILVALLAGVGCATPTPVVRLSLDNPGAIWISGRETLVQDVGGVKVASAFERGTEGVIAFRVELQNDTDQAVELSPATIWYRRCHGPVGLVCDNPIRVRDPEAALADVDRQAAQQRANAANSESWTTGLVLLSAVSDIAGLAAGDHQRSSDTADLVAISHAEEANHQARAGGLENTRQMWANVALRRTTVAPGHGAGGLVFMSAGMDATFVRFTVAVGERRYESVWQQEILGLPQGSVQASSRTPPPLSARNH